MSVECTAVVWKRDFGSGPRKAVAARLADHADDEGRGIFPSIERTAAQCNLSERTVGRVIKEFVREGILTRVRAGGRGPGSTAEYDMNMAAVEALPLCLWGEKKRQIEAENDEIKGDRETPLEGDKGDSLSKKGDSLSNKGDRESPKPSKNHHLTANGRAGARESADDIGLDEKGLGTVKRRKLIDRSANIWPAQSGSIKQGMSELEKLGDDDLIAAVGKMSDWLEWWRPGHDHTPALSTYVRERRWEQLPEAPPEPPVTHLPAKPYGKLWNARRLALLDKGPLDRLPPPSAFIQAIIDGDDRAKADREIRNHAAKHGYPGVNAMHHQASEGRGTSVPVEVQRLGEQFRECRADDDNPLWVAWQDLHAANAWPPMDRPPSGYAWLPVPADAESCSDMAAFVRDALAKFQSDLAALDENEETSDDDSAA